MAKATITMDELLASDSVKQIVAGEVVTGHVLSVKKHEVLIDLGAQGVGYVPRREVGLGRQLNVGDEVTANVVAFSSKSCKRSRLGRSPGEDGCC